MIKSKEKGNKRLIKSDEDNDIFVYKMFIFIGVISVFGYILNIFKIISIGFDEMTFLMIIRLLGILLFPIGIILGYY